MLVTVPNGNRVGENRTSTDFDNNTIEKSGYRKQREFLSIIVVVAQNSAVGVI